MQISFQPGLVTSVNTTKTAFAKFVKASTVDNIEAAAQQFICSVNPTITFYECGTSTTCASANDDRHGDRNSRGNSCGWLRVKRLDQRGPLYRMGAHGRDLHGVGYFHNGSDLRELMGLVA